MINGETPEAVSSDESLGRFILQKNHFRNDLTVKPDAFIPYSRTELSVTRHIGLSVSQIWEIGWEVALKIGKPLFGRADIKASIFENQKLTVIADPLPNNPNHANVKGWPAEKPAQKILALEIAAAAGKMLEAPQEIG